MRGAASIAAPRSDHLDLLPWSFAYRRGLGVRDALACLTEARESGSTWVARADIDDCFDEISHPALLDRVRARVGDKHVLALVEAFLKSGILG